MSHSEGMAEDIQAQIEALNADVRKYENILQELETEQENVLKLQNKDVTKLYTDISKGKKKAAKKSSANKKELISKEAKKIESSVKKLMQLRPSEELEQINSLIEKYIASQGKK